MHNKKYLDYIRSLPCEVCGKMAIAHHEQITGRGMGTKCSDYETIPLCNDCHRLRHNRGKYSFWIDYFFTFSTVIRELPVDFCLAKLAMKYMKGFIENG